MVPWRILRILRGSILVLKYAGVLIPTVTHWWCWWWCTILQDAPAAAGLWCNSSPLWRNWAKLPPKRHWGAVHTTTSSNCSWHICIYSWEVCHRHSYKGRWNTEGIKDNKVCWTNKQSCGTGGFRHKVWRIHLKGRVFADFLMSTLSYILDILDIWPRWICASGNVFFVFDFLLVLVF